MLCRPHLYQKSYAGSSTLENKLLVCAQLNIQTEGFLVVYFYFVRAYYKQLNK